MISNNGVNIVMIIVNLIFIYWILINLIEQIMTLLSFHGIWWPPSLKVSYYQNNEINRLVQYTVKKQYNAPTADKQNNIP